jgi:hypothetical protein
MTDRQDAYFNDRDQETILRDMVIDIDKLIRETRGTRTELKAVTTEIEDLLASGQISQLRYDIEQERIHRASENVNFCLRRLDRQKKIILEKLREYESK